MDAMQEHRLHDLITRLEAMKNEALEQLKADGAIDDERLHDADERAEVRRRHEIAEERRETTSHALQAIKSTLERIRSGRYGQCVRCGIAIPKARLLALPTTTHCVVCQSVPDDLGPPGEVTS